MVDLTERSLSFADTPVAVAVVYNEILSQRNMHALLLYDVRAQHQTGLGIAGLPRELFSPSDRSPGVHGADSVSNGPRHPVSASSLLLPSFFLIRGKKNPPNFPFLIGFPSTLPLQSETPKCDSLSVITFASLRYCRWNNSVILAMAIPGVDDSERLTFLRISVCRKLRSNW